MALLASSDVGVRGRAFLRNSADPTRITISSPRSAKGRIDSIASRSLIPAPRVV
jgi:hypothetical protein